MFKINGNQVVTYLDEPIVTELYTALLFIEKLESLIANWIKNTRIIEK
jgi:hypothetical protein